MVVVFAAAEARRADEEAAGAAGARGRGEVRGLQEGAGALGA